MTLRALLLSDHKDGSSARSFSSFRRSFAVSQSKMPPQERQRPLDFIDKRLRFRAHTLLSLISDIDNNGYPYSEIQKRATCKT